MSRSLMRVLSGLCCAYALFDCFPASAADARLTIYGVELQAPLRIRECQISKYFAKYPNSSISMKYEAPKDGPCFESMRQSITANEAAADETLIVRWPLLKGPGLARGDDLRVRMVGGKVERIWFVTNGAVSQEDDLLALKKKFGESPIIKESIVSNRLGASFPVISAVWKLTDDITVQFLGIDGDLESGSVVIASSRGEDSLRSSLSQALDSGRQQL
ncbi:TPA: hypothetical protein ACXN3U_000751 [Stenotrophomonas maltophilia]